MATFIDPIYDFVSFGKKIHAFETRKEPTYGHIAFVLCYQSLLLLNGPCVNNNMQNGDIPNSFKRPLVWMALQYLHEHSLPAHLGGGWYAPNYLRR